MCFADSFRQRKNSAANIKEISFFLFLFFISIQLFFSFNARAASVLEVPITNSDNSITASMFTSMGATKGQVMKFNGSGWVASSLTNAQIYQGSWSAFSNSPNLNLTISTPGDYYIVSVSGTFESIFYDVGDWIIFDGFNWQKVGNGSVVVSTFNGRRGAVTMAPTDYVSLKNGLGKISGSSLDDFLDVNISSPLNGSVLKYDTATNKWVVGVDDAGAGVFSGTSNKAVATGAGGALNTSSTSASEVGHLSGVTSSIQDQLNSKLSTTLADGKMIVGNAGTAAAVNLSGDATLSNAGVLALKSTGTAGTYHSVTTDAAGRVTSGSTSVSALTAMTGNVTTAAGTGSVVATISSSAVNSSKIADGALLPVDVNTTGGSSSTSGFLIYNLVGGFSSLVCSTNGHVPTWTVTGFVCMPVMAGSSVSALKAAISSNSINNLNFAQIWNWATATTESLLTMAADVLTTGSILSINTSNSSVNSTNGLLNVENSGASVNGVLASFKSNSSANTGLAVLNSSRVGVGTFAPAASLEVDGDVKVGNSLATCSATTKGSLRYNDSSSVFEFCNGLNWFVVQASTCSDETADVFHFDDQINAGVSTLLESNIIEITGVDCRVSVSVAGGGTPSFRICADAGCGSVIQNWTSTAASMAANEYIQVKLTSSATNGATVKVTINVGGLSTIWNVSTEGDCSGTPAVGTICADGTVYAGLSPDGSVKMYTTRCDSGQTWDGSSCQGSRFRHAWDNGSGLALATGFTNPTTGKANSAGLYALVNAASRYSAATYCEELIHAGHSDWYLPSQNETTLFYNGRFTIGNFLLSGIIYWTSTEVDAGRARSMAVSGNNKYNWSKNGDAHVRCVRR